MVAERCRLECRLSLCLAALFAVLVPAQASAATCGTALNPLSVSATGVNFGTYEPSSQSATEANGTVRLACDLSVDLLPAFIVGLSSGAASQFSPRTMVSGASRLFYDLYTTPSHTSVWGDGTSDTETPSYDGLLVLGHVEFTIHGAAPPGQFVAAGAYSDTIIVTIEY